MTYRIEKAEEGTPAVDLFLADGWEPFAVVSEPRHTSVWSPEAGGYVPGTYLGHVNVIWFRRVRE